MGLVISRDVLPLQGEFLACQDNVHGMLGGLGAGKTKVASMKFTDRIMQYPKGTHGVATKDLKQWKRGTAITFLDELKERGIKYQFNRTEGEVIIRSNGARVIPLSAENYENWRALEADTIWADELTTWGPSGEIAFKEYLVPRARLSPEGKRYLAMGYPIQSMLFFSTNPPTNTAHWLYDLLVRKQFCKYWNLSTYDNHLLGPQQDMYIEKLERMYSPDLWPILIGGQFGNASSGSVYKGFDPFVHDLSQRTDPWPTTLPPVVHHQDQPLLWALDFNVGLMCSVVGQFHMNRRVVTGNQSITKLLPVQQLRDVTRFLTPTMQSRIFYILDEIRMLDAGTPNVVAEFIKRWGDIAKKRGVRIYGDASGGTRAAAIDSASAARSQWAIILQGLLREGIPFEFRVQRANPPVMDRINMVKAQLVNVDGSGLIIDGNKCPYLVQDLLAVKFRQGTNDIDKNKETWELTHLSDALGYMLWLERTKLHERVEMLTTRDV